MACTNVYTPFLRTCNIICHREGISRVHAAERATKGHTHGEGDFCALAAAFSSFFAAFRAFSPSFIAYSPIKSLIDVCRLFAKKRKFSFSSMVSVSCNASFLGLPVMGRGILSPPFVVYYNSGFNIFIITHFNIYVNSDYNVYLYKYLIVCYNEFYNTAISLIYIVVIMLIIKDIIIQIITIISTNILLFVIICVIMMIISVIIIVVLMRFVTHGEDEIIFNYCRFCVDNLGTLCYNK